MDDGKVTALTLLDLSAAFYSIHHTIHYLPSKSDISFGVPQGSVLGLLLFTLYTTPLNSLMSGLTIPHHLYADDSQLYVSFSSGNSGATPNDLQSRLASVQSLMSINKLKLNPDKTEFLLIGINRNGANIFPCFL